MKLTKQQMALWIIYSLVFAYTALMLGCANVVLPDTDLCIANVPGNKLGCYNLKTDYTASQNGLVLKAGAKKHYRPLNSIEDIGKWTCTDPDGWANAVAFFNIEQTRCVCQ